MEAEDRKALVRRFYEEVWRQGNYEVADDVFAPDYVRHDLRPTQTAPTAFTALADHDGSVSHPYWPRLDRCIDYIWVSERIRIVDSGTCFDKPGPEDPTLWPSDHIGVWADLELA